MPKFKKSLFVQDFEESTYIGGKPLHEHWRIITSNLPEFASFFSKGIVQTGAEGEPDKLIWETDLQGDVKRLDELPGEDKRKIRAVIDDYAKSIDKRTEELLTGSKTAQIGEILKNLCGPPDESNIFVVGGKPVATCWSVGTGNNNRPDAIWVDNRDLGESKNPLSGGQVRPATATDNGSSRADDVPGKDKPPDEGSADDGGNASPDPTSLPGAHANEGHSESRKWFYIALLLAAIIICLLMLSFCHFPSAISKDTTADRRSTGTDTAGGGDPAKTENAGEADNSSGSGDPTKTAGGGDKNNGAANRDTAPPGGTGSDGSPKQDGSGGSIKGSCGGKPSVGKASGGGQPGGGNDKSSAAKALSDGKPSASNPTGAPKRADGPGKPDPGVEVVRSEPGSPMTIIRKPLKEMLTLQPRDDNAVWTIEIINGATRQKIPNSADIVHFENGDSPFSAKGSSVTVNSKRLPPGQAVTAVIRVKNSRNEEKEHQFGIRGE
jgi:hypothetical protein